MANTVDCTQIKKLRPSDLVLMQVSYDGGATWMDEDECTVHEARTTEIDGPAEVLRRAIRKATIRVTTKTT